MIAELPCQISQPEHVVEEIVYGGPFRQVVAGYCAELRFCRLGHHRRAEDFCPGGARRAPRGHPLSLVPAREVADRLLHSLAVVGPEERQWADPTCMCTGVSSGPPQRKQGCGLMATPESRSFRMRSLRCTGVWPSLARSTRWLVAVAVRSRTWT